MNVIVRNGVTDPKSGEVPVIMEVRMSLAEADVFNVNSVKLHIAMEETIREHLKAGRRRINRVVQP